MNIFKKLKFLLYITSSDNIELLMCKSVGVVYSGLAKNPES